jgi:hypothetical protein
MARQHHRQHVAAGRRDQPRPTRSDASSGPRSVCLTRPPPEHSSLAWSAYSTHRCPNGYSPEQIEVRLDVGRRPQRARMRTRFTRERPQHNSTCDLRIRRGVRRVPLALERAIGTAWRSPARVWRTSGEHAGEHPWCASRFRTTRCRGPSRDAGPSPGWSSTATRAASSWLWASAKPAATPAWPVDGLQGLRLRQRRRRELLRDAQEGTRAPPLVADPARADRRDLRVHRSVLQPAAPPLDARDALARRLREQNSRLARIRPRRFAARILTREDQQGGSRESSTLSGGTGELQALVVRRR